MDLEREIRRLKRWNALFVTLLLLLSMGFGFRFLLFWNRGPELVQKSAVLPNPEGVREARSVFFSVMSDGPYVLTHVTGRDGEGDRAVAALDPPRAFVESGSLQIDPLDLDWRDRRGDRAEVPSADFEVLYFTPDRAISRKEHLTRL